MKISYSQVEAQCNELHSVAKKMKEILENVDSIRTKVQKGDSWSGEASSTYSKKLEEVAKNYEEVFLEIENSILYMANCSEGYQAIDQQVMNEICTNLNITEPNLGTSNIFGGN